MEKGVDGNRLIREIFSLISIFICIFLFLSIYSYSPKDPSFNVATSNGHINNLGGIVGSYIGGLIVELLGNGGWAIPFFLLWAGLWGFFENLRIKWYRIVGIFFLYLFFLILFGSSWGNSIYIGNVHGGGYVGKWLYSTLYNYLNFGGILLLLVLLFIIGIQLVFLFFWKDIFDALIGFVFFSIHRVKNITEEKRENSRLSGETDIKKNQDPTEKTKILNKKETHCAPKLKQERVPSSKDNSVSLNTNVKYPPIDLLDPIKEQKADIDEGYYRDLSQRLVECLKDFGIDGELLNIKPGPVVTMFEFKPAPGIKISKISQLNNDLALALKAVSVRIEAPIPGKDYIGIEIPNKKRKVVYFREIIESKVFKGHTGNLPIVLGQDIQGRPRVEDLSKMPHLLVAGATGAGKSVCLNSIIVSLLMRFSPEEVKFLLIDPKRIEMASYSDLPHLIHPVVTEMELAKTALEWAVFEMENRYNLMAKVGVRNIYGFNQKVKVGEIEDEEISFMPYVVIIIDEMADLMLTVGKDAESQIIRLAQLARAAGIHLILATQRPSVDVVTGLIKANFPARIGFQVTSKHDSRTILDTVGAEHLLGKGDMLFKPPAGKIERIHGSYISDREINRIIGFWEQRCPKKEHVDLKDWKEEKAGEVRGNGGDVFDDPMYKDAVNFVMEQGRVSISMLQRYLRIGFNRAARFVEQMEKDGIIGPQEGSKPRVVIKK